MRDLLPSARLRALLSLSLLLVPLASSTTGASIAANATSLRSLKPEIARDEAPPVFCLDLGLEIAFRSRDVESAMGGEKAATPGTGCLRSSPMNAVVGRLKTALRSFSLHAVDCVLEPQDVESSTIALHGIASVCSRSNMEVEEDIEAWGRETKRQVDKLFEKEKRISFDQTTGMVGHVAVSPAYELPSSGSGLPQCILGETQIWSDGEEGDVKEQTKEQAFFTHVQLNVKNDGKTPLHLYRLTLVEKTSSHGVGDGTVGFVLPLVTPAVVQPEKSESVSFKAITEAAVDASKSYLLYISHSGFRSHVFEGVLDGKRFLAREEAVQPQGEDGLFDRFSLDSTSGQSLLSSFPYATWQGKYPDISRSVEWFGCSYISVITCGFVKLDRWPSPWQLVWQ
ncbi:unnamed protein product [Phytophthora lilii]|uniref:Unnamed protein product n=1 Tax=Phytophthora lilii TaxID=2077276 RepID=A0A9W6WYN2_9STRA|nr:unnamed protein product [Phytophthora lilii]